MKVTDLKLAISEKAFEPHLICSIIIPLAPLQEGLTGDNLDELYLKLGKELIESIKEVTPPAISDIMWPVKSGGGGE